MRRETPAQRAAWTAHVEGAAAPKANKYGAVRKNGYASTHEADVAGKLQVLAMTGAIKNLREQVSFMLVEGNGKIRPIRYVADFVYETGGKTVVADAKGYSKNPVYRLKKKLMALIHGITIEEL